MDARSEVKEIKGKTFIIRVTNDGQAWWQGKFHKSTFPDDHIPTTVEVKELTQLQFPEGVKVLEAFALENACLFTTNDGLYGVGSNFYCQLGLGIGEGYFEHPTKIKELEDERICQVATGYCFAVVLTDKH